MSGLRVWACRAALLAFTLAVAAPLVHARAGGGQSYSSGRSSYGVHVVDSNLTILRSVINQGNGAAGSNGNAGSDATSSPPPSAANGGNALEFFTACDNTTRGLGGLWGPPPPLASTSCPRRSS